MYCTVVVTVVKRVEWRRRGGEARRCRILPQVRLSRQSTARGL
jgi:hypothetical protein